MVVLRGGCCTGPLASWGRGEGRREESNQSHESEAPRFNSLEQFLSEDLFGGVEGQVESGDACVGRGEVLVVRRSNHDGGFRGESLRAGWKGRRGRPEVQLDEGWRSRKFGISKAKNNYKSCTDRKTEYDDNLTEIPF